MTQLCLFCRNTGLIAVETEGDLGTYVDCGYCDALGDKNEEYEPEEKPDKRYDYEE